MAATLCKLCEQIGNYYMKTSDETNSYKVLSGYSLAYLEQSDSCSLCRLFRTRAFAYPSVYEDGIEIYVTPGKGVHLGKLGSGSGIYHDWFPFCTLPSNSASDEEAQAKNIPLCDDRLPYPSASSDGCMALAADWLRQCLTSHERCKNISAHDHPARFLHVGDLNGPDIKLVAADDSMSNYIALSHTWGKVQPLTTTLETLDDRHKGIPISILPPTFRDAVFVTRKLGSRYLWIDSLCIVQDDDADWERESAKMHNVYRGALVTISALHGSSSSSGLFAPRMAKPHVRLPLTGQSERGLVVYVTTDLESRHDILGRSVLSTRGWTLQERLLSPRLLHFSEDEILWECLTCILREGSRSVVERLLSSSDEEDYHGPLLNLNMPPADWSKQREMLAIINEMAGADSKIPSKTWYIAVSNFSGRTLTYSKDKLPALSGLAAEMRLQTQYTYLAGLWKEDLLAGLCWRLYPKFDASAVRRSGSFRAPSWSWASLDGKVEFFEKAFQNMFDKEPQKLDDTLVPKIIDSHVTLAGLDPMGAVSAGHLILQGVVIPLGITYPQSAPFHKSHRVRLGPNNMLGRMIQRSVVYFQKKDPMSFFGVLDSVDDEGLLECYCVPLAVRLVDSLNKVVCLLLVPTEGQVPKLRRAGLAWLPMEQARLLFTQAGKLAGQRIMTIV